MLIKAQFKGVCRVCGDMLEVGSQIEWRPNERGAMCVQCVNHSAVPRLTDIVKDTATPIPCPSGLRYMPFQVTGIRYALTHRNTLIADEMGLGKTVQAIGYLNANPEILRVLIVCPASLKRNWQIELDRWLTAPLSVGIFPAKADITIINYDILHKLPQEIFDLVILDETHYIKNPKSKRSRLASTIARRSKHILALTGTPILAKPVEMWPIVSLLAPSVFDPNASAGGNGFWDFSRRYCAPHKEYIGGRFIWFHDGATNLGELQSRLRDSCMVRRLKKDVLTELPPKRRQIIVLPGEGKDENYGLPDLSWDTYEETLRTLRSRKVDFEHYATARHEQAVSKIPAAIDFIREALESSDKIVVFAHHKDVIDGLEEGLKDFACVKVCGETLLAHRSQAVERFQNDPNCRVFIGSITAAGVGLTLTASSHVIFVELDHTPGVMSQAEDRCHRIGQCESVLVQHLVRDKSLDAKIARALIAKQAIVDATVNQ